MTAEIIHFTAKSERDKGNGAREALVGMAICLPDDTPTAEAEMWADWVLAELWSRGFKVVPLEGAG